VLGLEGTVREELVLSAQFTVAEIVVPVVHAKFKTAVDPTETTEGEKLHVKAITWRIVIVRETVMVLTPLKPVSVMVKMPGAKEPISWV